MTRFSIVLKSVRAVAALAAALLALSLPAGGWAQSADETPPAQPAPSAPSAPTEDLGRPFTGPEWRALVEGKTLYYETSRGYPEGFGLMGKEYYVPNSNKVVFVYANGDCYEGTWEVRDQIFCYNYDRRHCFRQFDRDGRWVVQEMDGREQVVVKVTNEVLSCAPGLTS